MSGNVKKSIDRNKKRPQKRKIEKLFNLVLKKHNSYVQNKIAVSTDEPPKKRVKSSRHGRQTYKKDIVKLYKNNENDIKEDSKKPMLPPDEYEKLKKELRLKKKFLKSQPRFWIREHGLKAILKLPISERVPLFLGDVQHLVLFALLGNRIHQEHSRWCHLERHGLVSQVVVLILEGVGAGDLLQPLKKTKQKSRPVEEEKENVSRKTIEKVFVDSIEIISPETYNRSLVDDFCLVPLSAKMCRTMLLAFGSKEAELKSTVFRAAFPIHVATENLEGKSIEETKYEEKMPKPDDKTKTKTNKDKSDIKMKEENKKEIKEKIIEHSKSFFHPRDKFSRVELLLSPSQMIEENYAVPLGEMAYRYQHYVFTKDHYAEVTPMSPLFGLDCEMCLTTAHRNELTRISIVDENHKVVYETLVMPHNRIINYLTKYSGITPQMMRGVKTTLQDVQEDIRRILPPDAILVGQSLNCDLHALEMMHPYVIDSSVIFNTRGQRKQKTKLKILVELFLGEKIQQAGAAGHDSIEDSLAALKLVQLKLSKSLEFGDTVLGFDWEQRKKIEIETEVIMEEVKIKQKLRTDDEPVEEYKHLPVPLPQPEVIKIMEASSLFKLVARRKKVGVFATPDILCQYSKYLSGHHEMAGTLYELRAGSHGFEAENNYKAVKMLLKDGPKFDLAVTHLKMDMSVEKQRARAVNYCLKVVENVQNNGMIIVVAGGRSKNDTDGRPDHRPACFVHLKLEAAPALKQEL